MSHVACERSRFEVRGWSIFCKLRTSPPRKSVVRRTLAEVCELTEEVARRRKSPNTHLCPPINPTHHNMSPTPQCSARPVWRPPPGQTVYPPGLTFAMYFVYPLFIVANFLSVAAFLYYKPYYARLRVRS